MNMTTQEALTFFVENHFEIGLRIKHGNAIVVFYGELFLNIKDGYFDLVNEKNRIVATFSENDVEYRNFAFDLKE